MKQEDVKQARDRIEKHIIKTPLLRQPAMDKDLGCKAFLKHEGLQITGSFKARGAMNKTLSLTDAQLERGVVCASSGNHAIGVAHAAMQCGAKATIVMPTNANPAKLEGVRRLGGEVLLEGTLSSERERKVSQLVQDKGMVEIHPFGDPYVAAGQGTIGLEVLEDLPSLSTIVVPIGGGGLISGVSTAVKGINPGVRVVGVEPEGAARYTASRKAGHPVVLESVDTIADGTRTDHAHPDNFATIEQHVDVIVTVSDKWIREAMKYVVSRGKIVAEPSSVMGVAAALAGNLNCAEDDEVCFVLSGGNNDLGLLASVLA